MGDKAKYIKWTQEKKEKLKKIYSTTSNKDLAAAFGIEVGAIESIAVRLKLLKTKETISKLHSIGHVPRSNQPEKIIYSGHRMIYKPDHEQCDQRGYIGEHRLIMGQIMGRQLDKGEIVLHKNGDNADNTPENLELKYFYRYDVKPMDIYKDRKSGMEVIEIVKKYKIGINTYYRKIRKAKKIIEDAAGL